MYNGATEDTPDKAQQGLLTERGMPPCILLIASRPALRERDIGTASMREAVKIEPVLEARKLDRTVCLRAFSILSPEMYPKACSRQNEKIKLHRPSLFSLRSGSAKEAENADGMTSENASHKNSGAPESLSLFLSDVWTSRHLSSMTPTEIIPRFRISGMTAVSGTGSTMPVPAGSGATYFSAGRPDIPPLSLPRETASWQQAQRHWPAIQTTGGFCIFRIFSLRRNRGCRI